MKKSSQSQRYRNTCGPRIRELRKERKLKQDELAARISFLGLSGFGQATIAKIETQYRSVYDFELVIIAKALETSMEDLAPGADELKHELGDLQEGKRKR